MKKQIIYGCEARGDAKSPYLTRYAFPRLGPIRPALHIFHRSDADELHDHPWPFVTVILWRGYIEETPCANCTLKFCPLRQRRRVWPGMILFRRATHTHRVELVDGKKAVTFVIFGKRVRDWGFYTKRGWQFFLDYFKERGC